MASRIPESFITEVRQKVNIVDVIGQYTDLVKRGRQWNGSCPFHDDHHPSLFVEENKQVFNCFSCGRSGSVFSFLMEKEGMSYPEAILALAESADMHVDSSISAGVTQQVDSTTQVVYQLHTAAQRLYQHILLNTTSGEQALAYLHEKRQLTDDIIKHFGIGFVPEDNALLNYATEQNISREMMRTSELFISNDQSELRDRFSGRIVWPIKTERGQVVGFSGRALNANNNIKYMNSPESPFFTKGKILYNFDLAKNQIRQTNTVMVFEGFMDVISASMAEKPVGVATMGTALTRDHVRQLSHVAKRILLVYDGDEAGQNAARRSIDLIREYAKNVDIGVVYLPDHLDPDEVRVQRGLPVLKQTLEQNIQTPVEFLVNAARVGKNLSNQVQYLAFLQEVMKTLKSASPVEQDIQLTRIANEFGTSKHALQTQLQQSVNQKANKSQQTYSTMVEPPVHSNDYDIGLRQTDINQSITQVEQAERALIMAMIKSPQVMIQVKETAGFAFVHPDYQLLMMLTNIYQTQHPGDFDLAQYMDFIQKPELNQKIMAIDRSYGDIAIEKAAINDYLRVIMHDAPIDAHIRELQQAINIAKQQHDDAKLLQLMTELINIKKKQSEL
ncbi:DNA primase [Leuconostoc gelidum]|uniref:DNA primase n=1 Tax=Leuconostoc gelidum TaxID=1244 RepID=UPI0002193CDD|nr:DNA primase [Leuconostoc gelidum]AFS40430.1 DNA primase [Leuconostoc gelidum JB7]MBZ5978375.1 DNA primase [Leuconostoc gelidum subsp. gelidum]MBZ5992694.1 DNA primase [Leuconostoc gelidum subsp. gelidum]USP16388.1 DNA primase [Leuconostoc gelidum subsp. aenigmaticum]GMA68214.1 DNA primase [Leuconostoc gelidum subsp. gelidum]